MNKILSLFVLTAALSVSAQSNNPVILGNEEYSQSTNAQGQLILTPIGPAPAVAPTNGANPFVTIWNYFSSFNPSLTNTFSTNNDYEAWIGASYQSATFLGGVIGFEAQPLNSVHGLTLRGVGTLGPEVGTLTDAEFDLGYAFTYVDTRILPFVGCNLANKNDGINQPESLGLVGGAEVQKAMTQNSFAGLALEAKQRTKGALVVMFETGVTF